MSPTEKVERCIRIATEYRGTAELRGYSEQRREDDEQKLTWHAAVPDKWADTLGGRIAQVVFIPLLFPLVLVFVYVIAPLITLVRKERRAKQTLRGGETLIPSNIEALARASTYTNLYDLWLEHGLPGRSSNVDFLQRAECLERWVDTLYGSGVAVIMRVKHRVEEVRSAHSRTMAELSARGGHMTLADPVDSVARELGKALPTFRSVSNE